jgi:predicted aldo/keto reductase-like oxidoreductase
MSSGENQLGRRDFFGSVGAVAGGGLLLSATAAWAQEQAEQAGAVGEATGAVAGSAPEVDESKLEWRNRNPEMAYARLGRTNFMMSRLALGGGILTEDNERILLKAIEMGLNYVDSGPGYAGGNSERVLGKVLKRHRDKLFIVTKADHIVGYPSSRVGKGEGKKAAQMFSEQLDKSLRVLGTDTIDCYMMHGTNEPWKTRIEEIKEAADKAREAGKIRFFGFSVHKNTAEVMHAGVEVGWYDVIMPTVNPGTLAQLMPELEFAKVRDVGIVGMKTAGQVRGERAQELFGDQFKDLGLNEFQRAYAYMFKNAPYAGCLTAVGNIEDLVSNLRVPAMNLTRAQWRRLDKLVPLELGAACGFCGTCTATCPHGVAVNTLVRLDSYYHHYDDKQLARELFAGLSPVECGGQCGSCRQCLAHCPRGLNVQRIARRAHDVLSVT